jgi:hypothetical protein
MRPLAPRRGLSRGSVSSRPSVRPCSDSRTAGPARDASTLVASSSTPAPPPGQPASPTGATTVAQVTGTAARVTGTAARVPSESVPGSPERLPGSRRNSCPGAVGIGAQVRSEYAPSAEARGRARVRFGRAWEGVELAVEDLRHRFGRCGFEGSFYLGRVGRASGAQSASRHGGDGSTKRRRRARCPSR